MDDTIDFVRSAVSNAPRMPAGIETKVSRDATGGVRITLSKGGKTSSLIIADSVAETVDSDLLIQKIFAPLEDAIRAVNGAVVPKRGQKKAKKKTKRKAKVSAE